MKKLFERKTHSQLVNWHLPAEYFTESKNHFLAFIDASSASSAKNINIFFFNVPINRIF